MQKCILCDASAVTSRQDNASRTIYNCPFCGVFVISDPAENEVKANRWKIASFLVPKNLAGHNAIVLISQSGVARDKGYIHMDVGQIVQHFPKTMGRRIDFALHNLTLKSEYPSAELRIDSLSYGPLFYLEHVSFESMSFVISAMEKKGFITVSYDGTSFFPCKITVTAEGWDRVSSLEEDRRILDTALIAVSGSLDYSGDYVKAVARACITGGYPAVEYPCYGGETKIGHELIAAIRECRFLVCDLSDASPSTYFTGGMAKALDKPVFFTCRAKDKIKVNAETEQIPVLFWDDLEELSSTISNAIRAVVI